MGEGAVWAVSGPTATVLRIDPRSEVVTPIPIVSKPGVLSPYPYMVAVGDAFVWVVNANTSTLTKIDPALRGVVQTVPLGHEANSVGLTAGAGAAWVVDTGDGTLVRVDARTNDVTSIPLGPNRPRDAQVFRDRSGSASSRPSRRPRSGRPPPGRPPSHKPSATSSPLPAPSPSRA